MTILVVIVVVIVVGILLTNTKRWRGLARGAKRAANDIEDEIQKPDDRYAAAAPLKARSEASTASRSIPRPMKTIRDL